MMFDFAFWIRIDTLRVKPNLTNLLMVLLLWSKYCAEVDFFSKIVNNLIQLAKNHLLEVEEVQKIANLKENFKHSRNNR